MNRSDNLAKGRRAEKKAVRFLRKKGYQLVEYNWRCNFGEIDLIGYDKDYLCFIEVKYRSSKQFGNPAEAVDHRKQKKLIKLAQTYMLMENAADSNIRFDVVEVTDDGIEIIKNAFQS